MSHWDIQCVQFHLLQIAKAKTEQDMEQVFIDIDYDIWEDMPWTKNDYMLNQARQSYGAKNRMIKKSAGKFTGVQKHKVQE